MNALDVIPALLRMYGITTLLCATDFYNKFPSQVYFLSDLLLSKASKTLCLYLRLDFMDRVMRQAPIHFTLNEDFLL